jgi:glutamate--cysteine ligase
MQTIKAVVGVLHNKHQEILIAQRRKSQSLLQGNLMGLEKEGLRVSGRGGISQAPHPKALGCALTHPNITTDFSESLIELVTPPARCADEMLALK